MGQAALNAVRTMPPAAVGTSQMLYVPTNFKVRPSSVPFGLYPVPYMFATKALKRSVSVVRDVRLT
jgi:hypothetical protein